jgi:pimeloyl-ACP methyl ester carboxylesterase
MRPRAAVRWSPMPDSRNDTRAPPHAMKKRRSAWRTLLAALGIAGLGSAPCAAEGTLLKDVTFADASAAATSAELARRLLTPLAYRRVAPHLRDARAMPLDVARERFAVYVPEGAPPPDGYAVLVFIPPWSEAALPRDWPRILDRHGMIFVSAANSGNDADTLDRRIPLALLGYENIRRRYPVDANRVYVGGLSGGSRVALRVALAWPDLFRGALLNAGSDPVGGSNGLTIPPADLFRRFQDSTRIVFLTGERDEVNVHNDLVAAKSLRAWCAFDQKTLAMPRRGHEIADAAALERALRELEKPAPDDDADAAACRKGIEQKLAADVADAEAAADHGERERAVDAMNAIDARYGGLAAGAIDDIERKIDRDD